MPKEISKNKNIKKKKKMPQNTYIFLLIVIKNKSSNILCLNR